MAKQTTVGGITFEAAPVPRTKRESQGLTANTVPLLALKAMDDLECDSVLIWKGVRSCPKAQRGVPVKFYTRNARKNNLQQRIFDVYAERVPLLADQTVTVDGQQVHPNPRSNTPT